MSRGIGKLQRHIKAYLQSSYAAGSGPRTFAHFCRHLMSQERSTRLDPTYLRSIKRGLKSLVNRGDIIIVKGVGGPIDPYHYSTFEDFVAHASMLGKRVNDRAHAKEISKSGRLGSEDKRKHVLERD
jgi:hypothetical protein